MYIFYRTNEIFQRCDDVAVLCNSQFIGKSAVVFTNVFEERAVRSFSEEELCAPNLLCSAVLMPIM
ncbi:hypothetical protein SC1083_1655 [Aggregatibacter actinomycetemcomitans serotype e str. SC1083]|uniref:Uncharacterized protein n=1 Tax=Aggregatibacter actinomycetemcomitans serotype e str. SC1083 TaxID=907488 RepID=G4A9Y2_AGGAC|nr:hypothetical protein SC1083_1655 [Aggregatibacter actinomycetemcomitans serotype e str. SC1083]